MGDSVCFICDGNLEWTASVKEKCILTSIERVVNKEIKMESTFFEEKKSHFHFPRKL